MPAEDSATAPAEPRLAALLLAAGLSTRMGGVNKLLVEIDGEPMVRRAARTLLACGLDVHVVVGHQRGKAEEALAGLQVRCVLYPDYCEGQQGSVRAGLAAIGPNYEAVLVALGDQPFLVREDIEALIEAYRRSGRDELIVPFFEGARGNPVVVPRSIVREIEDQPANLACRRFSDRFPGRGRRFDAANDHFVRDIDTAEALCDLMQRDR